MAKLSFTVLALSLEAATGFMAAPVLHTNVPVARMSTIAAPVMSLSGGRPFGGFIRSVSIPKFPGFGKGVGGMGRGSNHGNGGGVSGPRMSEGDDDEEEFNPLTKAWKQYEELLEQKPLLMKAITSLVGFALGDILAQLFIQKSDAFDFKRLFRLASFGFLVHGTTSHWFYGMLDGKIPGTSAKVVFTKVFIDQVIWNPIFGVMFFSYVALLEAKGLSYVVDKVQNELLTAVTGSWKVWPLAHTINFRFVPSSQRVLYINSIQIFYNCFLSIISNRESKTA